MKNTILKISQLVDTKILKAINVEACNHKKRGADPKSQTSR
jgi:hypothetical protein